MNDQITAEILEEARDRLRRDSEIAEMNYRKHMERKMTSNGRCAICREVTGYWIEQIKEWRCELHLPTRPIPPTKQEREQAIMTRKERRALERAKEKHVAALMRSGYSSDWMDTGESIEHYIKTLERTIAELRAEVEKAQSIAWDRKCKAREHELTIATQARVIEKLKGMVSHYETCAMADSYDDEIVPCDCGLEKELAAIEKEGAKDE